MASESPNSGGGGRSSSGSGGDAVQGDRVLSYATAARPRSRPGWLYPIGLAQVLFGVALLCYCAARFSDCPPAAIAFWFAAFLTAAAFAGVCQAVAGLLLLTRRWGRPHVVRGVQRLAILSLVPVFLAGTAFGIYAVLAAYRGATCTPDGGSSWAWSSASRRGALP